MGVVCCGRERSWKTLAVGASIRGSHPISHLQGQSNRVTRHQDSNCILHDHKSAHLGVLNKLPLSLEGQGLHKLCCLA